MAKTVKTKNLKSKTSWLKLSLELIVVFIGVSAGFLFDNFREEQSNRKLEDKYLDFISGEFVEEFSVDDTEFRNITGGYYTLSSPKMLLVHTLDSLNKDLKNLLAALNPSR